MPTRSTHGPDDETPLWASVLNAVSSTATGNGGAPPPLSTRIDQAPGSSMPAVGAVAVPDLPAVRAGDDLPRLILRACAAAGLVLEAGDVVVVSSKVVSKAMGLTRTVTEAAERDAVVVDQSVRLVARRVSPRGPTEIVQSMAGPVMAAAGVDASNTAPGTVLVLPPDPDAAARALRAGLRALGAPVIGVVVSDTAGRPWRMGQTDFALGSAGLQVTDDLRGTTDTSGVPLMVTERALIDEVAALADLVKGKVAATPVAIVRGLTPMVTEDDGPGARTLLRDRDADWFRLGHVEAVRAALGVDLDSVESPSIVPETLDHRVARACEVALSLGPAHRADAACDVLEDDAGTVAGVELRGADAFTTGVLVSRLLAALWTEDVTGRVRFDRSTGTAVVMVAEVAPG